MNLYDKFYSYLGELDESYGKLAGLLRQKTIAVQQFDMEALNELMKQEQVYVLLSKGFDTNLRMYRDQLNLHGDTLTQVIEELPDDEKGRFQQQYTRLKTTLDAVKGLNESCQSIIEERLYSLDKSIKALDKSESATYRQSGDGKIAPSGHLFTKSI